VRVVRTPDGEIEVDLIGKANGRGAYFCNQRACWEAGLEKDRLGRALRTTVSPEARERLRSFAAEMEG